MRDIAPLVSTPGGDTKDLTYARLNRSGMTAGTLLSESLVLDFNDRKLLFGTTDCRKRFFTCIT